MEDNLSAGDNWSTSTEKCIKNKDAKFRFIALALCVCANFGWYNSVTFSIAGTYCPVPIQKEIEEVNLLLKEVPRDRYNRILFPSSHQWIS
jgi:hypothetical protein